MGDVSLRGLVPTVCFLLIFLCSLPSFAAAEHPAMAKVRSVVEGMVDRIASEQQVLEEDAERLYQIVADLITPNFDFATISRLVLGSHWKSISADQRQEFTESFRLFLIRTYSRSLLKSVDVQVEYLDTTVSQKRSDVAMVKTNMTLNPNSSFAVNYRMVDRGGQWKVVDIVVDGVSLLSTYRGSFRSTIEERGIDGLLTQLRAKNAG